MVFSLVIGGKEYAQDEADFAGIRDIGGFDLTTLMIEDVAAPTGDTAEIKGTFRFPDDTSRIPQTEEEIVIKFGTTVLFGGIIEVVNIALLGQGYVSVSIQCRDYSKWLDQKLMSGVFVDGTAGAMVKAMVAQVFTGTAANTFTTNNVETVSDLLPKVFNFIPLSEAIQEIADIVGAVWFIDFQRDIHFASAKVTTNPLFDAPISLIDVDNEINIGKFKITRSTEEIQNSLIVKDFFFRGPNLVFEPGENAFPAQGILADQGNIRLAKKYVLNFTPYDLTEFTFEKKEPSDGSNWISKQGQWEGVANTTGLPATRNDNFVYISPGSGLNAKATVYWSFNLAAGSEIRISYRPLLANVFPDISREPFSIDEFSRRESSGGRASDGIYERLIQFNDLEFAGTNPIEALLDFGGMILTNNGWPRVTGSFETRTSLSSGWKAGQTFEITSEGLNIFDLRLWVQRGRPEQAFGLSFRESRPPQQVWVRNVRIRYISHEEIGYRITFSNTLRIL